MATMLPACDPAAPRVIVDREVPPEVAAAIAPYLDEFAPYWPRWVVQVYVYYDTSLDGLLRTNPTREYCRSSVTVGAQWLTLPPEERRWSVLHEVTHALHAQLDALARSVIDASEDALGAVATKVLREQLRVAVETTNVQIWDALGRAHQARHG